MMSQLDTLEVHLFFERPCPKCQGEGVHPRNRHDDTRIYCESCHGSGQTPTELGKALAQFLYRHYNLSPNVFPIETEAAYLARLDRRRENNSPAYASDLVRADNELRM